MKINLPVLLPPSSFFDKAASVLGAISFFFGEVSINTPLSIVAGSVCVRASAMQHNWPEALRNYESLHIFGCSWTKKFRNLHPPIKRRNQLRETAHVLELRPSEFADTRHYKKFIEIAAPVNRGGDF